LQQRRSVRNGPNFTDPEAWLIATAAKAVIHASMPVHRDLSLARAGFAPLNGLLIVQIMVQF